MPPKAAKAARRPQQPSSSTTAPAPATTAASASGSTPTPASVNAGQAQDAPSTATKTKRPPKKKARTAAPAPATKKKTAAKAAASAASPTTTPTPAAAAGLSTTHPTTRARQPRPSPRVLHLLGEVPSTCSASDAIHVARYLDAKLDALLQAGEPQVLRRNVTKCAPQLASSQDRTGTTTSLPPRVDDDDDFSDDSSMDDDAHKHRTATDADTQSGAAALLMLGQASNESITQDEYGRTVANVSSHHQLLLARRDWLKQQMRCIYQAHEWWRQAHVLDGINRSVEPAINSAEHALQLVKEFCLPQHGLPLLLSVLRDLHAALDRTRSIVPADKVRDWDFFVKQVKSFNPYLTDRKSFLSAFKKIHFDLLQVTAKVTVALADMRAHFEEHVRASEDVLTRPPPYSYGSTRKDDVSASDLKAAARGLYIVLIDQMASRLGANLESGPRHRPPSARIQLLASNAGSGAAGSASDADKWVVTPTTLMETIGIAFNLFLRELSLPFNARTYDLKSRYDRLIEDFKLPPLSSEDWALFSAAQRRTQFTLMFEEIESISSTLREAWHEYEKAQWAHRDRINIPYADDASNRYATVERHRDSVDKVMARFSSLEARVLSESQQVLRQGSDLLAGATGTTPVILPDLSRIDTDLQTGIYDIQGRVAALDDMTVIVIEMLHTRFHQLVRISRPSKEPATLAGQNCLVRRGDTPKGFFTERSNIRACARAVWALCIRALELLHATLHRLTSPEWIDLDEVSDLEAVLIQAERGQRGWNDQYALSTSISRMRLQLLNTITEVRMVMAQEILVPWLDQVDWTALDRVELWQPSHTDVDEQVTARWAAWKEGTMRRDAEAAHLPDSTRALDLLPRRWGITGEAAVQDEDKAKGLTYRRHMYLVQLWLASSLKALRHAGFSWACRTEVQTPNPFSRAATPATREALRHMKKDVKLSLYRDDWQTSANRAEAVMSALRAAFHAWRASSENNARFRLVDPASRARTGDGEEGTVSPAQALPAVSFLPGKHELLAALAASTTGPGRMDVEDDSLIAAIRAVRCDYLSESGRRQLLGGLVLLFRVLIGAPEMEAGQAGGGSRSQARGTAGAGGTGGSGGSSSTSARPTGSSTARAGDPTSSRAGSSMSTSKSASSQGAKSKDKGQNKGKGKSKEAVAQTQTAQSPALGRLPSASRAWKMHLISLHGCRKEEVQYLFGKVNKPEPYMNDIRRVLSLKRSTDTPTASTAAGAASSSSEAAGLTAESTEPAFGAHALPSPMLEDTLAQNPQSYRELTGKVKKGLPVQLKAVEDVYSKFIVGYRERCFWIEVVRATFGGDAVRTA